MIRIIHVSDLHLESENPSLDKKTIIASLANDLKININDNTLFFFTGDLIDQGGIHFNERENAFQTFEALFIEPILKENPTLKGKIFIVPGNHEVFRDKIDRYSEAGLKSELENVKALSKFIESNRTNSNHLDRLSDYKSWERAFYKKYNSGTTSNFENSFIVQIGTEKIGISCLNSAWMCKDDNDKENILLGKNQIESSLKKISDCKMKFALSHHPVEFLTDFDRESTKKEIYKSYDIHFTGHVHELVSSYTQNLLGNIFISIANATIGDSPKERKYINGYTIIDFYPNEKIIANYRKYIEQQKVFVPNTDIGTENGSKEFIILKNEKLKVFEKTQQIVTSIENRFCERLNEDLIMADSSISAICSIDNLFVEPSILNCPQNSLKEEDTIHYSINNILSDSSNYLIYGLKESGKTILIDKMFIEATKRFNEFKKIPILIKFSELKKKKPIKIIKEFLAIPNKELDNYLQKIKIILFIDDIQFNEKFEPQINSLISLIEQYKTIQLVVTSDQILDNVIPTDHLEYNDQFDFNIVFIQSFSSNNIKQLVKKWFGGKEVDLQECIY